MTVLLKKIVIIGGGVGGLKLATQLGKKLGRNKAEIILVDYNHNHLWKPLLHKVATGSINENINTLNYSVHAQNNHFQFQLGTAIDIDREKKTITLASLYDENERILLPERKVTYDTLVMALGSVSNNFKIPGVEKYCVFLDNQKQAFHLRCKIFNLFLKHSTSIDSKINITIIGGGATGVELSAELCNTVRQLRSYSGYEKITNKIFNITLIEAGERILPALPHHMSNVVYSELIKLNIHVLTQAMVVKVDEGGLYIKNGKYIKSDLMIWVAGIKAPDFIKNINGLETNCINQLIVRPTLQTTHDPDIFAIGDCAYCSYMSGSFVPPRAQAAHQMANLVYYNILAQMKSTHLKTYTYKDHGSLISIANYSTIGNLIISQTHGSIIIKGCVARLIYISLYRVYQITLYGYLKTGLMILVSGIIRFTQPRLKLH